MTVNDQISDRIAHVLKAFYQLPLAARITIDKYFDPIHSLWDELYHMSMNSLEPTAKYRDIEQKLLAEILLIEREIIIAALKI